MPPPRHTLEWSGLKLEDYFIVTKTSQIKTIWLRTLQHHCFDYGLLAGGDCNEIAERLQKAAILQRYLWQQSPPSSLLAAGRRRRADADRMRAARREARLGQTEADPDKLVDWWAADRLQGDAKCRAAASVEPRPFEPETPWYAGPRRVVAPSEDGQLTERTENVQPPSTPPPATTKEPRGGYLVHMSSKLNPGTGAEGSPEWMKKKFFRQLLLVPESIMDTAARRLVEDAFEQALADTQRRREQPSAAMAAAAAAAGRTQIGRHTRSYQVVEVQPRE